MRSITLRTLTIAVSILLTLMFSMPYATEAQKVRGEKESVAGRDILMPEGSLTLISSTPIGRPAKIVFSPEVVDPNSVYSNVTTFTGSGITSGGAAADPANAANTITRLVADDMVFVANAGSPPYQIVGMKFTVVNFNTAAVSARPRVRLYQADGAGGGPGTLIAGFTFNPITFTASTSQIFNSTINQAVPSSTIWVGITFDNNAGATGATAADLNNLGQAVFNPVDRGSSQDRIFTTLSNGSFLASNPAGAIINTPGIVDNLGFEFTLAAPPTAAMVTVSGRVTTSEGRGVREGKVWLTDGSGSTRVVITGPRGEFTFTDVEAGQSYVISVASRRFTFSPASQVIAVTDNISDVNFTAQP